MREEEPLGLHPIAKEILASLTLSDGVVAVAEGARERLGESLLALSGAGDFDRAVLAFVQIAAQLDARGAKEPSEALLAIAELGVPAMQEQRMDAQKRAAEGLAARAERFRSFSGAGPASLGPVDTKSSLEERSSQRLAFKIPVRG
jgi:hypothetical protein